MGVKWAVLSWVMEKKGKNKHRGPCPSWGALETCRNNCKSFTATRSSSPILRACFVLLPASYLSSVLSDTLALNWALGGSISANKSYYWCASKGLRVICFLKDIGVEDDWLLIKQSRTHLSKSVCRDWGHLSYFHKACFNTGPWILLCHLKPEKGT